MQHLQFVIMLVIATWAFPLFGNHETSVVKNNTTFLSNHSTLNNVVVISCSGKAGSCTLETSFKATGIETYRCHTIDNKILEIILSKEQTGNVILIDSIRDIISRKIASFFQNLPAHLNLPAHEILAYYKNYPRPFMRFLKENFRKLNPTLETYNTFNNWQQFHYNCLTDGVFDFNKKYQLKQIGNLYFINLRFDDIKNWEKIIKSIGLPLDLSRFKIIAANQASDKWYADIYRDFLANFTLTRQEFDSILSAFSEELAHFYTAEEIDAFIMKWTPYIE